MCKEESIQRALGTLPGWRVEVEMMESMPSNTSSGCSHIVWHEFVNVRALDGKTAEERALKAARERGYKSGKVKMSIVNSRISEI